MGPSIGLGPHQRLEAAPVIYLEVMKTWVLPLVRKEQESLGVAKLCGGRICQELGTPEGHREACYPACRALEIGYDEL